MTKKKLIGNTRGPRPNAAMIKKVLKLREQIDPETGKPFSFREIARRMKKGIKRVHTWYQYGTGVKAMRD